MHRQTIFLVFVLFVVSIVFADRENKKTCVYNLILNGTNLIAAHRKRLLVLGITNLACPSCQNQAIRYNDLYRDLERHHIGESIVRLALVNEYEAAKAFPNEYYDKIRIFQDTPRDRFIERLGKDGERMNNLIFGRCGYLLSVQRSPRSNLEIEKNYQELLRTIITAVKNKRRCQTLCS